MVILTRFEKQFQSVIIQREGGENMKKVLTWLALITAGILMLVSGCIPVPIPIDLGNPGIEPQVFEVPAGSSTTLEARWTSFTIKAEDVKSAQQSAGVPGTVHFHNIEVSGKITVEGSLTFNGFIDFSLEEPTSIPETGDVNIDIDTSQKNRILSFHLRQRLKRLESSTRQDKQRRRCHSMGDFWSKRIRVHH